MRNFVISLLAIMLMPIACFSADVRYAHYDSDFGTMYDMKTLNSIETWYQPKTQYTPKNLRTEQQMRFSGRSDTGVYESYTFHFTDYDTYIKGSQMAGNDYYIYDNLGNKFKTGEHTDLTPVYDVINTNTTNIEQNTQQIQNNSQRIDVNAQNIQNMNKRMDNYGRDIAMVNNRVSDLEHNMYAGLATVTALTSLHPNPRSTAPIELSVGTGIFRDQVAGAVGLFAHPNDRIMIQGGFSFDNVGITIGTGKSQKH